MGRKRDIVAIFANLMESLPGLIEKDEIFRIGQEKATEQKSANQKIFDDMKELASSFGLDAGIVRPPRTDEDPKQYATEGIAGLLTSAKGSGVGIKKMVRGISQLQGASEVPGFAAAQTRLAELEQQQAGVNIRGEQFGLPRIGPEQQAQQDIQGITGGQPPPSIIEGLSGAPGPETGIADIGQPPQQQQQLAPPPPNLLDRLQVEPPIQSPVQPTPGPIPAQGPTQFEPPEIPARRQEAIDAGISGPELDRMLSDLRAGVKGVADFDDQIARATTAATKKMAANRKFEQEKREDHGARVDNAILRGMEVLRDGTPVTGRDPNDDPLRYTITSKELPRRAELKTGSREGREERLGFQFQQNQVTNYVKNTKKLTSNGYLFVAIDNAMKKSGGGGIFGTGNVAGVGLGAKLYRNWLQAPEQAAVRSAIGQWFLNTVRLQSGVAVRPDEFKKIERAFNLNSRSSVDAFREAMKIALGQTKTQMEQFEKALSPDVMQLVRDRGLFTSGSLPSPSEVPTEISTQDVPDVEISGPEIGAVEDGYRFLGGDPSKPESWEKL